MILGPFGQIESRVCELFEISTRGLPARRKCKGGIARLRPEQESLLIRLVNILGNVSGDP